jgi:hypothetical protein
MIIVYYNNVRFQVKNAKDIKWRELHRDEDKPSIIWPDLHTEFYKNGKCQGIIFEISGSKLWFKDGVRMGFARLRPYVGKNGKIEVYHGGKNYYNFYAKKIIFLQIFIKLIFYIKYNKLIWSPTYLGGKMVKKQILSLFNFS